MYKKFLLLFASLFFLAECGYSPMYSKNINKDINLRLLKFDGDREINKILKYNLERYDKKNEQNKISISISSNYTKTAGTKNLAGDITSYDVTGTVVFKIHNDDINKTIQFTESTTINNQSNQLDESIYEKNIKQNFAELFTNKLIIKLLKLK